MFPARRLSPYRAARQALEDAKLNPETLTLEERRRIGVVLGSGGGGLEFTERQYAHWFQRRAEESQCLYHSDIDDRNAEQRDFDGVSLSWRQSHGLDRLYQFDRCAVLRLRCGLSADARISS